MAGAVGLGFVVSDALGLVPGATGVTGTVTGVTLVASSLFGSPNPFKGKRHLAKSTNDAPELHQTKQIHTVSGNLLDYQGNVASPDDVAGIADRPVVDFAEEGFLFTLVDDQGLEHILPVNLSISNRFLNRGWASFWANHSNTPYNRVAIKPDPLLKKGKYVLEMRNQTRKPRKMDHFYFRLQQDQVGLLVSYLQAQNIEKFILKLEPKPKENYQRLPFQVVRENTLEKLPLTVTVPVGWFTPGSQLVLMDDGALGWILPGETKAKREDKMYVRLPKHQITELVKALSPYERAAAPELNLSLSSTYNGAKFISTEISANNVSLSKTFGAPLGSVLGIPSGVADIIMFGIGYILPGFASLITPALKKYGEKRLLTLSLILSTLSGSLATVSGFYGHVLGIQMSDFQQGMFVTSLVLMGVSSILKQLTMNLLIRANGGEVEYTADPQSNKSQDQQVRSETPGQFMHRRVQEVWQGVFNSKENKHEQSEYEKGNFSHIIRYNRGFIFKNVGTLAFLAAPFLINWVAGWFGRHPGLDFSVSFPLYALYSAVLTWRLLHTKLRDAYSAKNVTESQEAIHKAVENLAKEWANPTRKESDIDIKTRELYEALLAYSLARVKVDTSLKRKEVYAEAKQKALEELRSILGQESSVNQTADSLRALEQTIRNMFGMLKVDGVLPLAWGMTLATIHEFVVSSSFAGAMNIAIPASDYANFIVACTLYGSLIVGRILGNIMSSLKISQGSTYLFFSSLSLLGTVGIGAFSGNVWGMIIGAIVASFGIGNFYTQMFNYITEKHRKYNRELVGLLSLTMAFGGLGATLAPGKLGLTTDPVYDMVFAGGLLLWSLWATRNMFKSSSIVQALEATPFGQWTKQHVKKVQNKWHQVRNKVWQKIAPHKKNKSSGPSTDWDHTAPAH